ncbi:MAG: hypothetical protein HY242_15755 [Afipia sp.]|nr:hypothetical protein [Afipia sp.]
MDERLCQIATRLAANEKFGPACSDGIAAATARCGFTCFTLFILDLRKGEQIAPALPCLFDVLIVQTHHERDRKRRIAMRNHERMAFVGSAAGNAEEFIDADGDCHADATDGSLHKNAVTIDFDAPHASVSAAIARIEGDRQRMGVELQIAARPDGLHPADSELTPHGFISHAGIMFPVDAPKMPELCPNPLKKAG